MSGKPFSPTVRWEADPPEPQLRPPEPWPPTYEIRLKHQFHFEEKRWSVPVEGSPYIITFLRRRYPQRRHSNGFASHSGVPPGVCGVEYEAETDQKTGQLQADIAREPQAVIQAEKAKAVRPGQTLGQSSPTEQGLIQAGAAGKHNGKYLLDPLNAPFTFRRGLDTLRAACQGLGDILKNNLEIYWALASDPKSWGLLKNVASDYLDTQHHIELTGAGGAAIPAIILTLITGGTGGDAAAVGASNGRDP